MRPRGCRRELPEGIKLEDFCAYLEQNLYFFLPTRGAWPASTVNARIGAVPLTGEDGNPVLDSRGRAPFQRAD